MGGNGHPIDRVLSMNAFALVAEYWGTAISHTTRTFSMEDAIFSPPMVLLEKTPMARCPFNFLHPIIIHWIHSFLLRNT